MTSRALLLASMCLAGPAWGAERAAVALVSVDSPDPVLDEALGRVRAELTAAGVMVSVTRVSVDRDLLQVARTRAVEDQAAGALVIAPAAPRSFALQAWEPGSRRLVEQQVTLGADLGPSAASVLAVRALEVLRAGLLELTALAGDPPELPPATPPVVTWVRAPLDDGTLSGRMGIAGGISLLRTWSGQAPQVAPSLRLSYAAPSWGVRLGVSATVDEAAVQAPAGRAKLSTRALMLQAWRMRPGRFLAPYLLAGLGLLALDVTGQAQAPFAGVHTRLWTPAVVAGGGLLWHLHRQVGLFAEIEGIALRHAPRVHLDGVEQGQAARVTMVGTFGLQGGL